MLTVDGGVDTREALQAETKRALDFLAGGGADAYLDASLVRYSVGRFKLGLERFGDILDRLACKPGMRMLDIGCGAGNWGMAHAIRSHCAAPISGVDRRDGFIRLASDLARVLALDNIGFRCGSAEDKSMYGEGRWAEFVLANSFLMFVNVDRVMTNIAGVLAEGGTVYGNYTTAAGRLASVLSGIEKSDLKAVRSGLAPLFGSAQLAVGLNFRQPSGALTAEQLTDLFEVKGFRLRESPGVHDWGATAAVGGVFDFILDHAADRPPSKAIAPSRLLELGCHETLLAVTANDGSAGARDLRMRALIARHGAANFPSGEAIAPRTPAAAVFITQRYLERMTPAPEALATLKAMRGHVESELVAFLIGVVALHSGDSAVARQAFEEVRSIRPAWSGGWVGAMSAICHDKTDVDDEVGAFFAEMVQAADFGLQSDDSAFARRARALA